MQILIVAAEVSSALYAQRLLEDWRSKNTSVQAFGVGSREMEGLGFDCVGRSEDLAVMGAQEIFSHLKKIRFVFNRLLEEAEKRKPDFILLMDYPEFNLRLASRLKKKGFKVLYFISPKVWAWRSSRIQLIKKVIDKMYVIFPFEKDFYKKNQVDCEFVGHPLLDEVEDKLFDLKERDFERMKYNVARDNFLLGLMPGSRQSELKYNFTAQVQAAEKVVQQRPFVKVAVLVAPSFSLDEIRQALPKTDLPLIFIKNDPFQMARLCDFILCASGTATLVVGLMRVPMIIMYKMNAISAWIARRFVKGVRYFGLVNLILDKMVAPEMFQEQANPEDMSEKIIFYLDDKKAYSDMKNELMTLNKKLGDKGAIQRLALDIEKIYRSRSL